jgi:hypothetical protein
MDNSLQGDDFLQAARAMAARARKDYEQAVRRREGNVDTDNVDTDDGDGEPPSETPTTYGECAIEHMNAALHWKIAGALNAIGFAQAAAAEAQAAQDFEQSASVCDQVVAAGGKTIELG